jgi:hypothetical protein
MGSGLLEIGSGSFFPVSKHGLRIKQNYLAICEMSSQPIRVLSANEHENSFVRIGVCRLQNLLQEVLIPALPGLRFLRPEKSTLETVL